MYSVFGEEEERLADSQLLYRCMVQDTISTCCILLYWCIEGWRIDIH